MLSAIVRKEIRNHILSFRFQAVFVLLVVVIPLTVLILSTDYVRRQDDASLRQAEIETYLSRYAHFNRLWSVIHPTQPPVPFMALVRGLSADVNLEEFDDDPLPVMFPLIDLTFIVTILLSLAALVFTYDAVSGEREDGTLKLMLANGVPRARIILGKIGGALAAIVIPFLTALLVGLLLLVINPRIAWSGADWGALGLLLAGAVFFLGLFVSLGVLISSRHRHSASSIMTSLFVWVLAVLVVPNLSPYAASLLSPTPSRLKIEREIARLQDIDRDDLGRKLQAERTAALLKRSPMLAPVLRMSDAEIQAAIRKDPALAEAYKALRETVETAWKEANVIQGAKAKVLEDDLQKKEEAQTRLSRTLSLLSPLADFTYAAADLSNTGLRNREHFRRLVTIWDRGFGDYMTKRMEALRQAHPTMDVWNTAVDVSDMPRFRYREEKLGERLRAAGVPLLVLFGVGMMLFAAAIVSFIPYDPR